MQAQAETLAPCRTAQPLLAGNRHSYRRVYDRRLFGEANDLRSPLIYWPKLRFPKHPRETAILSGRNAQATGSYLITCMNGLDKGIFMLSVKV